MRSFLSLGENINSFRARRHLDDSSLQLSNILQRLASGKRINNPSDDAAGLAIASDLSSRSRVFTQAIRNLNDGVSVTNIADSALGDLSGIVIRIKELAEQAANGSFSAKQRLALDKEAQALSKEFFRISRSAEFNNLNLFDGNVSEFRFQGGYGVDGGIASGLGGVMGDGALGSRQEYSSESDQSFAASFGDVNNDGHLDLITAGDSVANPGYATVRLGNGGGSFGAARSYIMETGAGAVTYALALGDMNNDGILDMATAGTNGTNGYTTLRLGLGDGTFGAAVSYQMDVTNSRSVAIGDLNNDGIADIVTGGTNAGTGTISVRLGTGNGGLGALTSYSQANDSSYSVSLGDFNGDSVLDVASGEAGGGDGLLYVRIGAGNGTFGATSALSDGGATASIRAVVAGDVNNDGKLDLITGGLTDGGSGYMSVRLGSGNGTFASPVTSTIGAGFSSVTLSLGDLNGDGSLDILTAGDASNLYTMLGSSSGTFAAAVSYNNNNLVGYGSALGDVNNDGVLDAVIAGDHNGFQGTASVRLGTTRGGVAPLLQFSLQTAADALQALAPLERRLQALSSQRSVIGALQSRLGHGLATLSSTNEQHKAAQSRIEDVDVAQESSNYIRVDILRQAATAILAQANAQPRLILALLE